MAARARTVARHQIIGAFGCMSDMRQCMRILGRRLSILLGAILQTESLRTSISLSASCVKRRSWHASEIPLIGIHTSETNTVPSTLIQLRKDENHQIQLEARTAARKTSVTAPLEKSRKFNQNLREHRELTKSITMCLAKDMLPQLTNLALGQ